MQPRSGASLDEMLLIKDRWQTLITKQKERERVGVTAGHVNEAETEAWQKRSLGASNDEPWGANTIEIYMATGEATPRHPQFGDFPSSRVDGKT